MHLPRIHLGRGFFVRIVHLTSTGIVQLGADPGRRLSCFNPRPPRARPVRWMLADFFRDASCQRLVAFGVDLCNVCIRVAEHDLRGFEAKDPSGLGSRVVAQLVW